MCFYDNDWGWFFQESLPITNNQWIINLKNHDWSFWLFVIFKESWFWLVDHDLMMKNYFEKSLIIMVGNSCDSKSWFFVDISWMIVNSHMINHVKKHKIVSIEPKLEESFLLSFHEFLSVWAHIDRVSRWHMDILGGIQNFEF